ncbi:MAG: ATP-binding cassette domain-containing protein, partial [Actinomycetes bacterium]
MVEVTAGTVVAFAVDAHGRRRPVSTAGVGEAIIGCNPDGDGTTLLVAGLPTATVRLRTVSDMIDDPESVGLLERWASVVGDASHAGRWVDHVAAPTDGPLRLAPGENVAATIEPIAAADRSVSGWLRVTSGEARYCGHRQALVGTRDPALPMTRGVWLTSGLRCTISQADPPGSAQGWADSLDLVGRLALSAVTESGRVADRVRSDRIAAGATTHEDNIAAGVLELSGAVSPRLAELATPTGELAAEWIVAAAVGLDVSDATKLSAEHLVRRGLDPIEAVAEACAARPRTVRLTDDWWRSEGPPLLLRRSSGSRIALTWRRRRWWLQDPNGSRDAAGLPIPVAVDAEVADSLPKTAVQLVPLIPGNPSTVPKLLRLASSRILPDALRTLALTALVAAAAFATPYVLGQLAGQISTIGPLRLTMLLLCLILLEIGATLWRSARGLSILRARTRSVSAASMVVWDRMIRLRARWHAGRPLGRRLVALTSPNLASGALPNTVLYQLLDAATVLGGLAAVATTTSALLAAVTALLIVQSVVGLWIVRAQAKQSQFRVIAGATANGRLIETLRGVNVLRIYLAQSRAFRRWAQAQAVLARADLRLRRLGAAQMVLTSAWPVVGLIIVVWVSAASDASFGSFVTAQTAVSLASVAIAAATIAAGAAMNARAQLREVAPVLEAIPEQPGQGESPGILTGDVQVSDVVFGYRSDGPLVLDGISFHIHPGEQVAIVGPSGCGKTTLLRILLGLEEPVSGVVAVDGRDVASLDRPALRRQIGAVLQSADLLGGTIGENIDMGRRLSTKAIWAALDAAAIGNDVRAMPLGLETTVTDGSGSLSGGQRQRILIARALAGDPRMLLFDEATSALDNVTQRIVTDSLSHLSVTRIVIAHRLSTVQHADRIIALADGKIVQMGTFAELMAQPGPFRELA